MQNISYKDTEDGTPELVVFKKNQIWFQNSLMKMVMIKSISQIVRYEKLKLENHFYEMLTATVSHEMRTPLNAMIGLLQNA